jgi:putative spermidine/putrescine transport system permease protein
VIGRASLAIFNALMVVFLIAPLLVVVWMSLSPGGIFEVSLYQPSLRWYREVIQAPEWMDALWLSGRLGLATAFGATALGFMSAYGIARHPFPGDRLIAGLIVSPLIVPVVTFAIALLLFVNEIGFYDSMVSLIAAHLILTVPLTFRVIYATLLGIDRRLELAAMNLGASGWRTLVHITLPLSAKGIATAFIFAFMLSFDEVTVTVFVTGPQHQTLPVQIFSYLQNSLDPSVTAISGLLVGLVLVAMLAVQQVVGTSRLSTFGSAPQSRSR